MKHFVHRPGVEVRFLYVNHRGEVAIRRVHPQDIWFGSTEWYKEAQWLLRAWDLDRQALRDFAMAGISAWEQV
jgi:predicted DNA-binding transcriptional regulator YafY